MSIPSYGKLSERQQQVVDSNRRTLVLGARRTGRTSTLLHRYHNSPRSNKALVVGTHPQKQHIIDKFSSHFGYTPDVVRNGKSRNSYDALFVDNVNLIELTGPTSRIVCATATMNVPESFFDSFTNIVFFRHSDNPALNAKALSETLKTTDRFDVLETPSGNIVVGTELNKFVYDEKNRQMVALPNDALLAVAAADCYDGEHHA